MIKYHCKNIRELFGHKYDLEMSKNSALPRFYGCLFSQSCSSYRDARAFRTPLFCLRCCVEWRYWADCPRVS